MPAVSITGAQFTVTVGSTDYTAQVTSGTVTITPTVVRTKTLDSVAFNQTDLNGGISIEFLYDNASGLYDKLEAATAAGTSIAVVVDGDAGTWTGSAMWIDSLETSVEAAGIATCSVSMQGNLSFA